MTSRPLPLSVILGILFLALAPVSMARAAGAGKMHSVANELDVLPAKLEKKTLHVRPRLTIVSRDRLVRSSVLAETGLTQLRAETVYNALSEELSYQLGYGYRTRSVVIGFSVFDRVEFEKEEAGERFIGRERLGGLEILAPLGGRTACSLNLAGGEYTSILAEGAPKVVRREQTYTHEWTLGIFPLVRGIRVTFKEGVRFAQSDFSFRALEAEAGWRIPDSTRSWILRAHCTAGAPVRRRGPYPLYERYYLGGRETMPGWRLYSLSGESALFGDAGLRLPVLTDWRRRSRRLWLAELSCTLSLHFAGTGGEEVFREPGSHRISWMAGPRVGFGLPGGTAVHLQGEWCHPVNAGRRDVVYLTVTVS